MKKDEEEVALVNVAARASRSDATESLVVEALLTESWLGTFKLVMVELEIVVVARLVVPVTSDVEVATPRVDDAETTSEVNVGLADTAIVEVEVRSMLDPAIK